MKAQHAKTATAASSPAEEPAAGKTTPGSNTNCAASKLSTAPTKASLSKTARKKAMRAAAAAVINTQNSARFMKIPVLKAGSKTFVEVETEGDEEARKIEYVDPGSELETDMLVLKKQSDAFWAMFVCEFWHIVNFILEKSEKLFESIPGHSNDPKRNFTWRSGLGPHGITNKAWSKADFEESNSFPIFEDDPHNIRICTFVVMNCIHCFIQAMPSVLHPVNDAYKFTYLWESMVADMSQAARVLCSDASLLGPCEDLGGGNIDLAKVEKPHLHPDVMAYVRDMRKDPGLCGYGAWAKAGGKHIDSWVHNWMRLRDMLINLYRMGNDACTATSYFQSKCAKHAPQTHFISSEALQDLVTGSACFGLLVHRKAALEARETPGKRKDGTGYRHRCRLPWGYIGTSTDNKSFDIGYFAGSLSAVTGVPVSMYLCPTLKLRAEMRKISSSGGKPADILRAEEYKQHWVNRMAGPQYSVLLENLLNRVNFEICYLRHSNYENGSEIVAYPSIVSSTVDTLIYTGLEKGRTGVTDVMYNFLEEKDEEFQKMRGGVMSHPSLPVFARAYMNALSFENATNKFILDDYAQLTVQNNGVDDYHIRCMTKEEAEKRADRLKQGLWPIASNAHVCWMRFLQERRKHLQLCVSEKNIRRVDEKILERMVNVKTMDNHATWCSAKKNPEEKEEGCSDGACDGHVELPSVESIRALFDSTINTVREERQFASDAGKTNDEMLGDASVVHRVWVALNEHLDIKNSSDAAPKLSQLLYELKQYEETAPAEEEEPPIECPSLEETGALKRTEDSGRIEELEQFLTSGDDVEEDEAEGFDLVGLAGRPRINSQASLVEEEADVAIEEQSQVPDKAPLTDAGEDSSESELTSPQQEQQEEQQQQENSQKTKKKKKKKSKQSKQRQSALDGLSPFLLTLLQDGAVRKLQSWFLASQKKAKVNAYFAERRRFVQQVGCARLLRRKVLEELEELVSERQKLSEKLEAERQQKASLVITGWLRRRSAEYREWVLQRQLVVYSPMRTFAFIQGICERVAYLEKLHSRVETLEALDLEVETLEERAVSARSMLNKCEAEEARKDKEAEKLDHNLLSAEELLDAYRVILDIREKGLNSRQKTLEAREKALEEREKIVEERKKAVDECGNAVQECVKTVEEREEALEAHQKALEERQKAFEERKQALEKHQKVLEEHQKALKEREEAIDAECIRREAKDAAWEEILHKYEASVKDLEQETLALANFVDVRMTETADREALLLEKERELQLAMDHTKAQSKGLLKGFERFQRQVDIFRDWQLSRDDQMLHFLGNELYFATYIMLSKPQFSSYVDFQNNCVSLQFIATLHTVYFCIGPRLDHNEITSLFQRAAATTNGAVVFTRDSYGYPSLSIDFAKAHIMLSEEQIAGAHLVPVQLPTVPNMSWPAAFPQFPLQPPGMMARASPTTGLPPPPGLSPVQTSSRLAKTRSIGSAEEVESKQDSNNGYSPEHDSKLAATAGDVCDVIFKTIKKNKGRQERPKLNLLPPKALRHKMLNVEVNDQLK